MKCPHCASWTFVKETRTRPEGYVRIRVCANEHRFKTVETVQEEPNEGVPTTSMVKRLRSNQ